MTPEAITLTRQELLDLVWSKPMSELAPTLYVTDVGLAKICKRLGIPRPKSGHWLKAAQHRPKQPALPAQMGVQYTSITFNPKPDPTIPEIATTDLPKISTKKTIHPLVRDCKKYFVGSRPNEYGRLMTARIDVQVSRTGLPRAISLLNTIVHTMIELGHHVHYSTKRNAIELCIDGEEIRVSLFEPATRSTHVLTKKEQQQKVKYGSLWAPRWDYAPSGTLELNLHGRRLYGIQTQWKDGKKAMLEDRLPQIVHGILKAADFSKARLREVQAQEHARLKAKRRRELEERAARLTEERIAQIESMVIGRHRAKDIRDCMSAIIAGGNHHNHSASKRRLVRWAEQLAKHYDPSDPFELPRYKQKNHHWSLS